MLIRYDGPGRLLRIPGKKDIPRGETVVVSRETFERLQANRAIDVTAVDQVIPAESPAEPKPVAAATAGEPPQPETTEPDHEEGT